MKSLAINLPLIFKFCRFVTLDSITYYKQLLCKWILLGRRPCNNMPYMSIGVEKSKYFNFIFILLSEIWTEMLINWPSALHSTCSIVAIAPLTTLMGMLPFSVNITKQSTATISMWLNLVLAWQAILALANSFMKIILLYLETSFRWEYITMLRGFLKLSRFLSSTKPLENTVSISSISSYDKGLFRIIFKNYR